MATISFTSAATQAEALIPERGLVTNVTVAGADYSFRQSGPVDLSIDFAPALKGGLTVVIAYTPRPRRASTCRLALWAWVSSPPKYSPS